MLDLFSSTEKDLEAAIAIPETIVTIASDPDQALGPDNSYSSLEEMSYFFER